MGIPSSQSRLLMRICKQHPFTGAVLQLGRQDVAISDEEMQSIAYEEKFHLKVVKADRIYRESRFNGLQHMDDRFFFRRLGFSTVHSLDISDYEAADILHDLNIPLPSNSNYIGKYDLIFDGGTMEHVFHVPNLLQNVFNLLAVNGRIVHSVPVDLFNHGFYNFSSCFFEDFYLANNFEINACWIMRMPHNGGKHEITSVSRESQFIRSLCKGSFKNSMHNLVFVATKLPISTGDKIPTQGYYEKVFSHSSNVDNNGLVDGDSMPKSIYGALKKIPVVSSLAKYLRDRYALSLVKWEKI
jgi:hypothetical protein